MTDAWTGDGYDVEAGSGGGVYLRLKQKGESVRLRLCSAPHRYMDELDDNGTPKPIKRVAWIAIHKELIGGKPVKNVVVFQSGPLVYGLVKELIDNPEWGDPAAYDITITRTEGSPYYTVTPMRIPFGPIKAEEQALLDAAGLDLVALCSKRGTNGGNGQAAPAGESDPFADD